MISLQKALKCEDSRKLVFAAVQDISLIFSHTNFSHTQDLNKKKRGNFFLKKLQNKTGQEGK